MSTKKRTLSAEDEASLRNELQSATLTALMDSRRWEPGDIAFQGGTSLHLAHGSARFSEDLDFMVKGGLSLSNLSKEVLRKIRRPTGATADVELSVTAIKDEKNPHSFYVTLSGPNVFGSVRVKIELWQTQEAALSSLKLVVSTVNSPMGPTFVPTLTLDEILVDKVFALGARDRIKPRDIFDLWWLLEKDVADCTAESLRTRLAIYPTPSGITSDAAARWMTSSALRLGELKRPDANKKVLQDLKRWLPSSWPLSESTVQSMIDCSVQKLEHGIALMERITHEEALLDDEIVRPRDR